MPDDRRNEDPEPGGAGGDFEEEFSRFFRQYARGVRGFLLRRGASPQLADDLVQETFLRAYERFGTLEKRGIPQAEQAWIFKIALSLFLNDYRDHRQERSRQVELAEPEQPFDIPDGKAADDIERQAIARQQLARIPGLVRQLPASQREVLDLWNRGYTYEQIGAESGKSLQNVRATLHKARSRLGEWLGRTARNRRGRTES